MTLCARVRRVLCDDHARAAKNLEKASADAPCGNANLKFNRASSRESSSKRKFALPESPSRPFERQYHGRLVAKGCPTSLLRVIR